MAKMIHLRDLCHGRSGDKNDSVNIGIICFKTSDYGWLTRVATVESVERYFGKRVGGPIERYEIPKIGAVNFLIHRALGGGVTRSLMVDGHGKGFSQILLDMPVEAPTDWEARQSWPSTAAGNLSL